jgi:hypothetical protein
MGNKYRGDQLCISLSMSLGAAVAAAPLASSSMSKEIPEVVSTENTSGSALEHSPEQKPKSVRSGWIEQYKVKRRESEYLYFRYCYRDGYRGKTHHHHLKPTKIAAVRALIEANGSIDEVLSVISAMDMKSG